MTEQSLATVEFHGHSLTLIEHDGQPHVAVRPIAEAIGLDWPSQFKRIKSHPVLAKGVVITTTPSVGGSQDSTCLALTLLNGWLFGIDTGRVKPELRDTLIAYQRECFEVLYRHWHGEPSTAPAPASAHPRHGEADAVVDANRMFTAYLRTAHSVKLALHRAAPQANARVLARTGIDLFADLAITEADLLPQSRALELSAQLAADVWASALDEYLTDRQAVRTPEVAQYLRGKPGTTADLLRVAALLRARGWVKKCERGLSTRSGGGKVWRRAERDGALS